MGEFPPLQFLGSIREVPMIPEEIPEENGPYQRLVTETKLVPNSPTAKGMVKRFEETIFRHIDESSGKSTVKFAEDLALDLWRETRK